MPSASDPAPRGTEVLPAPRIAVTDLTLAYGGSVIQRDLTFAVQRGEIFVVMGGSGCGKSTLFRALIGLLAPTRGDVLYDGSSFCTAEPEERERVMRRFGVLYQKGAPWTAMTLAENVALPLQEFTDLTAAQVREVVALKLALVGLAGFEEFYPSELSGGMQKRAGLARAMALDPDIFFLDEPSTGLDPVSSRRLDELLLELRDSLGVTVVLVSHELASIFALGDNAVFLDGDTGTMIAQGNPRTLLAESSDPKVREFLTRGKAEAS